MAPLGNGSAVVLIEKYKGLILKIKSEKNKQSFAAEETPIGVQHSV